MNIPDAPWTWNVCCELFSPVTQVVDIFHAKQKVWDIGRVIYGKDSDLTGRWVDDQIAELKQSEVHVLLETLSKYRNRHQYDHYFPILSYYRTFLVNIFFYINLY